ncbi:MAG: hypothetical protein PWR10_1545 [Halanaerobiales bacterium]|nr:hypothetical protein [Halanaerobiales bacterium]
MVIRITSKKEGFRRCGISHSTKPTLYPNNKFTKEELETLKAEPMLVVEEDIPASEKNQDPDGDKDKGKKDDK